MTTTEAPKREILYQRPHLYPKQEAALFHDERWGVVEASTKAGKTVGCLAWLTEKAAIEGAPGRNYWWVAPIVPQTKIAYRREKRFLPDWSYDHNETERTITLANGAIIWFKSAYDPDSLYGDDVYAVVIDEATRCRAAAWVAIRTTLTATGGPARIIGNVKGSKNWAYRMARKAEKGAPGYRYAKLTVWDAVEAGIFPMEEALDAQDQLTEAEFAELYLAKAADTDDQFFHTEQLQWVEDWPRSAQVARAWDFAVTKKTKGNEPDFTVGFKMAWDGRRVYIVDVVRKRDSPEVIVDLVKNTARKDGKACAQVIEEERGSAGKMVVEQFRRLLKDVGGAGRVYPSPVSGDKPARAFHFAARVNEGNAAVVVGGPDTPRPPWIADFEAEADDFPDGDHDDIVDAGAHAYNHLVPRIRKPGRSRVPGSG